MTVHFIGAGPGAPDLLTLRGRDLIAACPVCLYAGSLVPSELLSYCPADAKIVNTASLSLDEKLFLKYEVVFPTRTAMVPTSAVLSARPVDAPCTDIPSNLTSSSVM